MRLRIIILLSLLGVVPRKTQGLHLGPLPAFFGGDVAAGIVAAATVAPWVASVDRAITLNAAGRQQSIWLSFLEDVSETFAKMDVVAVYSKQTVQWLWFVYAVTYIAANLTDSVSQEIFHVSPALPVLWTSTTANTLACVAKDAAFAQMYSNKNTDEAHVPPPVPVASYFVWLLRDILTAFSAFTLPPLLQDQFQVPTLLSRFAGPVVAQYFTTPLHLTGLALYYTKDNTQNQEIADDNNDSSKQLSLILTSVKEKLPETILARQARIIPAFSIGGVVNSQLRDFFYFGSTTINRQPPASY